MATLQTAVDVLVLIEQDSTVPKNVRTKVKDIIGDLQDGNGKSPDMKIDHALQELSDIGDDPNLPAYTRTQIWNVVSTLESA